MLCSMLCNNVARVVNLLDNEPHMPTLQAMHRALAKHPMLQVELFLLLDELVHKELCCMNAFIGRTRYGIRDKQPVREDDFASNIQISEAQGRGFTHGHEKIATADQVLAMEFYSETFKRHIRRLDQWWHFVCGSLSIWWHLQREARRLFRIGHEQIFRHWMMTIGPDPQEPDLDLWSAGV